MQRYRERVVRFTKHLIVSHQTCSISNLNRCELYYEIIDNVFELLDEAIQEERALMQCGHPRASLLQEADEPAKCRGCLLETQVRAEMEGILKIAI